MKNSRITNKVRLQHIAEAIEHIELFVGDVTEDMYLSDLKLQAAVERKLEIIGEAANHVSYEITEKFPDIEWAKLRAFRNIIAHEYFGVSQKLIWDTLNTRLPELKRVVYDLLKNEF